MNHLRQFTIRTTHTEPLTCPDHRTYRYTDPMLAQVALANLHLPTPLNRKALDMVAGFTGVTCMEADIGPVHVEISVKPINPKELT